MSWRLSTAVLAACTVAPNTGSAPSLDASVRSSSVIVSLTFDDTLSDQYQVGELLAAWNMHATFFVNSPRIGQTGYMSLTQVRDLRDRGNEIGGHTLDHLHLTQLDPATAQQQICDDRSALIAMGFDTKSFAY